jgi:hypothetical protein
MSLGFLSSLGCFHGGLGLFGRRHLGVKLKQLFQPLGVVLEAAADVDALQHFVVALVGMSQVVRHGVRVVQVGDGGGEMRFAASRMSSAQRVRSALFC